MNFIVSKYRLHPSFMDDPVSQSWCVCVRQSFLFTQSDSNPVLSTIHLWQKQNIPSMYWVVNWISKSSRRYSKTVELLYSIALYLILSIIEKLQSNIALIRSHHFWCAWMLFFFGHFSGQTSKIIYCHQHVVVFQSMI